MAVWSTRIQQLPGRVLLDEMLQCKNRQEDAQGFLSFATGRMLDDELLKLNGNGLLLLNHGNNEFDETIYRVCNIALKSESL
ncbi:unnamed protein product [Urochloa humidicola]